MWVFFDILCWKDLHNEPLPNDQSLKARRPLSLYVCFHNSTSACQYREAVCNAYVGERGVTERVEYPVWVCRKISCPAGSPTLLHKETFFDLTT